MMTHKKPTLKYLLEWVGAHKVVARNNIAGNWKVTVHGIGCFYGDSLYKALYKAHKIWKDAK